MRVRISALPCSPVGRALFAAAALLSPVVGRAEEAVDYARDVKPLLAKRCYACHAALKQEGGLRLDTGAAIRKGGESGAAVTPGQDGDGVLLARVGDPDPATRMPPEGEPLTEAQVALLRAWVGQGAVSPADEKPEADPREHWAFRRPVRPAVPADGSRGRNPIDAFLSAERNRRGLSPLPRAAPQVLLRRVYLDLIGLPPTREELHAFLADGAPDAYEKVVDRLLADPRHGERWGRHWMDVWRYSDWYGRRSVPDVLHSYGMIWRWRDWIVRGVNEDRAYDEMVRMMLAADELDPTDDADAVATGFLVRNFFRWNYDLWKKENVEHVGKAFLGLTVNCAHCHDHKYDPITQEDYFRLRAVFEPIEIRHDRVPGEPDPGPYPKYSYGAAYPPIRSGLVRVMDERLDAETFLYSRGESRNVVPGKPPIPPGAPGFLADESFRLNEIALPVESHYPALKAEVRREELASRRAAVAAATQAVEAARAAMDGAEPAAAEAARLAFRVEEAGLAAANAELASYEARVAADLVRLGVGPGDQDATAKAASKAERQAAAEKAALELAKAERALFVAKAKAAADAAAQAAVAPAEQQVAAARQAADAARTATEQESVTYTPLGPAYPTRSTGRRAALATWITSPTNPLTARVAVNHLWRWHFGKPFVATTADFGRNGAAPTHPELLDWLAVELMGNGESRNGGSELGGSDPNSQALTPNSPAWRMKRLHRLVLTSDAYAMQSHAPDDHPGRSADAGNRWYWRFEPGRVEAEVVRDGLLHAAGSLDERIGGPDIDQAQGLSSRRRSLYYSHHGETRMTFLDLFDAADPCDCYKRTVSVIPQQALALTNNELLVDLSVRLEARLWEEVEPVAEAERERAFTTAAFEQVLSRAPSGEELTLTATFLDRQAALFAEGTNSAPTAEHRARARRGLVRALFNHNDFVTVR